LREAGRKIVWRIKTTKERRKRDTATEKKKKEKEKNRNAERHKGEEEEGSPPGFIRHRNATSIIPL
jgi:hypothetical protein